MLSKQTFLRASRGFSLIELMVSIVIGLLVAAGATALIVAINQANAVTIGSTHLTQELRTTLELIAAELRRARRVDDSFGVIGQVAIQSSNNITNIHVITDPITASAAKDCIAYAYVGAANNGSADAGNGATDSARGGINFSVIHRVTPNNGPGAVALASSWPNSVSTTTAVPAGYDCTAPTTGTIISSNQIDITGLKFEAATPPPPAPGVPTTVDNDAIKVTISGRLRFRAGANYGSGNIADRQLTQIVNVRSPKAGL